MGKLTLAHVFDLWLGYQQRATGNGQQANVAATATTATTGGTGSESAVACATAACSAFVIVALVPIQALLI